MSEEEEYYEEGEFEEGEEGEEGEEEEAAEEEEDEETKRQNALADIALIQDIFSHVECTSRRITESLLLKDELRMATETIKALEAAAAAAASSSHYHDAKESDYGDGDDGEIEEDSVTWSQYEELDEARRAKLLEKSIMLLGGEGVDAERAPAEPASSEWDE